MRTLLIIIFMVTSIFGTFTFGIDEKVGITRAFAMAILQPNQAFGLYGSINFYDELYASKHSTNIVFELTSTNRGSVKYVVEISVRPRKTTDSLLPYHNK